VVQTIDSASTVQTTGSAAPPPPPTPSAGPVISSFSPDTTPVGDGHTTATSITLTGTGEANSTVNVFDGTTSVGHASVNASGDWSLPASGPTVGPHSFTATDTDANGTSAASAVYAVTVDAPTAPHGHGVHGAHTPLHLNDLFFA
jgi:Bacterial Ig-like domain